MLKVKCCCQCSHEAELSIGHVVSTVGISPRLQRSSPVVHLCHGCMGDLLDAGAHRLPEDIRRSVNAAYTRIKSPANPPVEPK
jgi:hypothetical protein